MKEKIVSGSRFVLITGTDSTGPFRSTLFINNGEIATGISKRAATLAGARKQAESMLRQARSNPGAELLVMGLNPHGKKRNPLRMVNSHFSTEEKMALGRLGIPWSAIQTTADARRARTALRTMEKARKQFGARAGHGRFGNPHRDPAATPERAQEIYTGFHAVEPEFVDTTNEPHIPGGDYAELGRLVELPFKPTKAAREPYQKVFVPRGEGVRVLSSPGRDLLYFAAGDQTISEKDLAFFGCGAENICVLGRAVQINYIAKKYHDEVEENARGKIVIWEHLFGEEDGVLPELCYDRKNRRIFLRKGNYQVENVGIVN